MADEVEISNVGGDGVAADATLRELVKAVQRMARTTGLDPKSAAAEIQRMHNKVSKEGVKVVTENRDALEDNTESVRKNTTAFNAFKGTLGLIGNAIGAVTGSFVGLTGEILAGGDKMSDFARHLPIVGGMLGDLFGYLDNTLETFQNLSMTGASFGNDLTLLRKAAAGAYMNLDGFAQLVSRNAETLAGYGGTVTQGALRIGQLNRALGDQRQELLNMGYTFEEINESLIAYQNLTRAGSRTNMQSIEEQATAAAGYAKNLMTLSKLTGQDIQSQRDRQAALQADTAFQMKMARMSAEERAKVEAGLAQALAVGGETGALYFKQQILGMPPLTEETRLFASTMSETAQAVRNMAGDAQNAGVTLDQFNRNQVDYVADMVEGAAKAGQRLEHVLAAGAAGMEGPGAAIGQILRGMGKQFTDYMDESGNFNRDALERDIRAAQQETNNRNQLTEGLTQFSNTVRRIKDLLMTNFITPIINTVGPMLNEFSTWISEWVNSPDGLKSIEEVTKKVTAFFTSFIQDFKDEGFVTAITNAFGTLADELFSEDGLLYNALSGLGSILGKAFFAAVTSKEFIGAVVVGIGAMLVARQFTRMLGGMFSGGGSGGGGSGGGGSGGMSGMGKLGKGIGEFAGQLGGGLLKGLAMGLSAFANPKILLGAAIFSGAVAIIGAGVAAASWLMGKSLPTMAEGLESLANVDGTKLRETGMGMLAVAGAMAAMGAGSVIGSLGNAFSGAVDGIVSFFGGETPIEKIVRFADEFSKLDGDAVQSGAKGVKEMALAMGAFSSVGVINSAVFAFIGDDFADNLSIMADAFEDINGRNLAQASLGVAYMAEALNIFNEGSFMNFGSIIRNMMVDPTPMAMNIAIMADLLDDINGRALAQASLGVAYMAEALSIFNEGSFQNFRSVVRNMLVDPTQFASNVVSIAGLFEEINGRAVAQASLGVAYMAEALSVFNEGSFQNFGSIVRNMMVDPTGFATNVVIIAKLFEEINGRALAQASLGVAYMAEALSVFNEGSFQSYQTVMRNIMGVDPTIMGEHISIIAKYFEDINGRNLAQASIGVAYMAQALEIFNSGSFQNYQSVVRNLAGVDPTIMGQHIATIAEMFENINGRNLAQASLGVTYMSEALGIFSQGVFQQSALESIGSSIASWFGGGDNDIADRIVAMATKLESIDGESLGASAGGISELTTSLSGMQNLLDTEGVTSYTTAIQELVLALGSLNEVLAEDNDSLFKDRLSAGEALQGISSSSQGSSQSLNQLNSTMNQILQVLRDQYEVQQRTQRATKGLNGNLQTGSVAA